MFMKNIRLRVEQGAKPGGTQNFKLLNKSKLPIAHWLSALL